MSHWYLPPKKKKKQLAQKAKQADLEVKLTSATLTLNYATTGAKGTTEGSVTVPILKAGKQCAK